MGHKSATTLTKPPQFRNYFLQCWREETQKIGSEHRNRLLTRSRIYTILRRIGREATHHAERVIPAPALDRSCFHALQQHYMPDTQTPPRTRKPRGPGRLKPHHYDYLRYRQAGKTQKEAAALAQIPIATAQRTEKHPDGAKYLQDIASNAQIAAQYGIQEAVKEVDRAIQFAYDKENPNAIAKLLEHKSKLYGLLVEKVDIKATYVDLKGALEAAKQRVLVQVNAGDRGILSPSIAATIPAQPLSNSSGIASNATATQHDHTAQIDASRSMNSAEPVSCLQENSASIANAMQAETGNSQAKQQVTETSSDNLVYVNSQNAADSVDEPDPTRGGTGGGGGGNI